MENKRWLIVAAAVLVMATTGSLYAWAIFTQPSLSAYRWDVWTTVANFGVGAAGALIGGYWQDRVGPQRVATLGVTLWGIGHMLAGWGTALWGTPWLLTSGLAGGVRAGMAYITPVSMVTKWLPQHRSFVAALLAVGFGVGAVFFNYLMPNLHSVHRLTVVMRVAVGAGFFVVALGAAWLFRNPPAPAPQIDRAETGLSPHEMIRTRKFYLVWLQLFLNAIAGITLISNALPMLQDLTHAPVAALACSFGWVSLFYALGRFLWGVVAERIGCPQTLAVMFALQALTLHWLGGAHLQSLALSGFAIILLCYGGGFGVMPAYSAQCFGRKYMGVNYAIILSAWGVAGIAGPLLIGCVKYFGGSCAATLSLLSAVLTAACLLPLLTPRSTGQTALTAISTLAAALRAPLAGGKCRPIPCHTESVV